MPRLTAVLPRVVTLPRLVVLALLGVLVITGCAPGTRGAVAPKEAAASPSFHGAWQDRPFVLPDHTLRDTHGQPFNLRKSPSRPVTLVYFGYPDCAHGCSEVLTGLGAALDRVPQDVRDDVGVLVIDIEPTPDPAHLARLHDWLAGLDQEFIGLTGSETDIHRIAHDLGVEIHRADDSTLVHSDHVIAFDRTGTGVLVWTSDIAVDEMAEDLVVLVAAMR